MATIDLSDEMNVKWLHPTGKAVKKFTKVTKKDESKNTVKLAKAVHADHHTDDVEHINNELGLDDSSLVEQQMARLQTGIARIQADIAANAINKATVNAFEEQSDIITKQQKDEYEKELATLLIAFYTVLTPVYASMLMQKRTSQFDKQVPFEMTTEVVRFIKENAKDASVSHVNTVVEDYLGASKSAFNDEVEQEMVQLIATELAHDNTFYSDYFKENPTSDDILRLVKKGTFDDTAIYKEAAKIARSGVGRQQIIKAIQQKYATISTTRAKTIARTETARAFNQSQFQADYQFLKQTNQMDEAYKELRSRSGDPCPFCQKLIDMGPIPFTKNFVDLGGEVSAVYTKADGSPIVRKLPINYESIQSGTVHPNCQCEYVLIIKKADGTILNSFDGTVVENQELIKIQNVEEEATENFNKNHDGQTGRFAEGVGTAEQMAHIISTEANIRHNNYETFLAVDSTAKEVTTINGGDHSVNIPKTVMDVLKKQSGVIYTHNHPSDGSFSTNDIITGARMGAAQIRAVGNKYTYTMTPKSSWPSEQRIADTVSGNNKRTKRNFMNAIRQKKLSYEEASANHWHEVMRKSAIALDMKYTRSEE